MAVGGRKYLPVSEELGIRAQLLDEGGPEMWREFMIELRQTHIGPQSPDKTPRGGASLAEKLQAPYLEVVAKRRDLT